MSSRRPPWPRVAVGETPAAARDGHCRPTHASYRDATDPDSQTMTDTRPDRLTSRLDFENSRVTGAIGLATLTCWLLLFSGIVPLPPLPAGVEMTDPGAAEAAVTGLAGVPAYLAMWGLMMAGMMYPPMNEAVRGYVAATDGSTLDRALAGATFLATFTLAWTALGVVPLAVDALVGVHATVTTHPRVVFGLGLLVAGGYQFTDWKRDGLKDCCNPMFDARAFDPRDAARTGLWSFRGCVQFTWVLCGFMVLVGTMNLFWMLLLTAVFTVERAVPEGERVVETVGVLALATGIAVLATGVPPYL